MLQLITGWGRATFQNVRRYVRMSVPECGTRMHHCLGQPLTWFRFQPRPCPTKIGESVIRPL